MSKLKTTDKTVLENLFEMKGGYVLNFTDRTMSNFFKEELDIDIYDKKYDFDFSSSSKANRLRGIWLKEDNKTISKIILSLIDYLEVNNLTNKKGISEVTATLIVKARDIANKLKEEASPSEESSTTNKTKKVTFLPEINTGTFSEQALDLVAKEFTNHLSNYEIRKIVYSIIKKDTILSNEAEVENYFENWGDEYTFFTFGDVLNCVRKKDVNSDKTISKIITTLLHPLNYKADEIKAENIANTIKGYLKYCDFSVKKRNNIYEILSYKELEKEEQNYAKIVEGTFEDVEADTLDDGDEDIILRQVDEANLREEKSKIRSIRDNHQAYMDVIEIFCSNPKKPTKELNDAYIFLSKKIQKDIKSLKLEHYSLSLYKPFTEDLYRAEIEWNGDGYLDSLRLNPKLSWDAVRPSLYRIHSGITNLCNIADEETEMTDDEKRLEKITSLISQQRNKETISGKEKVEKVEILHKYEKTEEKPKIKLSDFPVSFDNETAQIKVGDFCIVDFPSHKNEHYLLRSVFSARKNEVVDWQVIYEAINSTKSETLNKKEIERQKKSVNDTVRSINKKVKEICNTDSSLLLWETKCVKRLH